MTGCNIEGAKKKWSSCKRGRRGQTLPCAYVCESHYHIHTCINYFITCSHSVVTGKRTQCKEEEIVLSELHQTDRRDLSYISPVPQGQEYYSPSKVIVWQLQAMEGHRVYLELSQIDLHNEDGKCSDYIEISFNPCTPPMKICDDRVNSNKWATSQTRVQVRFVSDHSKPTNGTGFRGAYYYYPVNTSSESTNSSCSQHALRVQVLDASLCSTLTLLRF